MGRGRIVGILVAIAIGAVAVVEVTAPSWVSAGMESRIRDDTSGRLVVEAEVSGPPLVTPILATGRLDWLEVDIIEVAGSPLPIAARIRAEGVTVDRASVLTSDVRVEEVDRAGLELVLDVGADLPPILRPFADMAADRLLEELLAAGADGALGLRADGDAFVLGDDLRLDVVDGLDGCAATSEDLVVTVTCVLNDVPAILLDALA